MLGVRRLTDCLYSRIANKILTGFLGSGQYLIVASFYIERSIGHIVLSILEGALMILPGLTYLDAQVVYATPFLNTHNERNQGLNEFCFRDASLIEAWFILAHHGYNSSNISISPADSKAGHIVAQRLFFLDIHHQSTLVVSEGRLSDGCSFAEGFLGELVTIEMLLRLGGVGQDLITAAIDIAGDVVFVFFH
jgi:hypothetical protein